LTRGRAVIEEPYVMASTGANTPGTRLQTYRTIGETPLLGSTSNDIGPTTMIAGLG